MRANTVLETGTSGTCTWTYALIDNVKTLTIKPTGGDYGTLGTFDWNGSTHKADTKRVVAEGTVKVGSSAKEMFEDFSRATNMDLAGLDLSEVTSTQLMFANCHALTTLNGLRDWNVSKVKNMSSMFAACHALTSLDVSNWNVGKVEIMHRMFGGCKALTSLDVKNWDASKVTDMDGMFYGCQSLTTLDMSAWQTSNVTNMKEMFCDCCALATLAVGNWDVSKVTNMEIMFGGCKALAKLDVSRWNTSSLRDWFNVFNSCFALTSLDLSNWVVPHTSNGRSFRNTFFGTERLATMYLGTGISGKNFLEHAFFIEPIGASVGTAWQQVNLGDGGTEESPKGQVFANAYELAKFHENRNSRKTDREGYVRVAATKLSMQMHSASDTGSLTPIHSIPIW